MNKAATKEKYDLQFASEVDKGLSEHPKHLPTRFIYDDEGSRLFEEIMRLPEYYLTRAEQEIMNTYSGEIASIIGNEKFNLIELGAGNGEKTATLIKQLLEEKKTFRYVPIDISEGAIAALHHELGRQFGNLKIEGINSDYFEGLRWIKDHSGRRNVVLFLGSNIGNFQLDHQHLFMKKLSQCLKPDDYLLIGFDLIKDYELIRRAYFDGAGVTARFNLNLIHRINRELGANFNVEEMAYYSAYNPYKKRNEAYVYSKCEQEVEIKANNKSYKLEAFEPINTEYSYKYSIADTDRLAAEYGFDVKGHFLDSESLFTDALWLRK